MNVVSATSSHLLCVRRIYPLHSLESGHSSTPQPRDQCEHALVDGEEFAADDVFVDAPGHVSEGNPPVSARAIFSD